MKTFFNLFSGITKGMQEYYNRYPAITRLEEKRAYYKSQNQNFPEEFLAFTATLLVYFVVCDFVYILDSISLFGLLFAILNEIVDFGITRLVSRYMYYLRGQACLSGNRKSISVQRIISIKISVAGLLPALMFSITPLFQPKGGPSQEVCSVGWVISTIMQLHACTWVTGGALYHAGIMLVFNTMFCGIAFTRGYFTVMNFSRVVMPIFMASMYFISLDRSNKENFVLKRSIKQQKKMYQKFLLQMQDPVLIYNREAKLLFHNKPADDWVVPFSSELESIGKFNPFASLSRVISSHRRDTLEVDIKRRLSQRSEIAQSVSKERYYSYPEQGRAEEELKRQDEDFLRTQANDSRRILDVTVIESTTMTENEKTVSLIIHDVTEDLEKEQKKAEEKYKNMLLFSLSHELKTPLNIFQGFLDASKRWITTDSMRNMLKDAKGAWQYLKNKIDDILDYAQVLSGGFALHLSTFSLKRFVKYFRKIAWCLLTEKRGAIGLEFTVDEALNDEFEGDRERLEQVLFNFLSNATRFTEKGTISLTVTPAQTADQDQPMATFTVRDTGSGMSDVTVRSLFTLNCGHSCDVDRALNEGPAKDPSPEPEPVHENPRDEGKMCIAPSQSRRFLTPDYAGGKRSSTKLSGLGLTVSKMICTKMGCDIMVTSKLGKGSSFSFSLPALGQKIRASPPVKRKDEIPGMVDTDGSVADEDARVAKVYRTPTHQKGIVAHSPSQDSAAKPSAQSDIISLIVDDNYFNRFVAETMIKKFDITTFTAENGKIAVEMLEKLQTDNPHSKLLVFMDLDMPVMDGIQATVAIREQNKGPRPYIVALTAFSAESERQKCFEAGVDSFMAKPITKERLIDVIDRLRSK